MREKPYMLATDLDGTLVGDREELLGLLHYYDNIIHDIAFVYVTGRHLASALSLIDAESLPMPDVLITDVGTGIYTTESLIEDKVWTTKMQVDWKPDLITGLASSIPHLARQSLPDNRRVSFITQSGESPVLQLKEVLNKESIAHKLIFSSNRDVDILPLHSGKGQALAYVLEKYASPNVKVLVAGDSGNDFDMLTLGYPSVIVGNAQNELTSMEPHDQLYKAAKHYAGGIHEAWMHFYGE